MCPLAVPGVFLNDNTPSSAIVRLWYPKFPVRYSLTKF